jgi:D-alanyl-D-alanine carboxypeptidase
VLFLLVILGCLLSISATVEAKPALSAIVVDARTGNILSSVDPDGIRHPASLTKMMTLYVLFHDLNAGKIKMDSPIRMSARAAGKPASKLGVPAGSTITVELAIKALVVKSANNVASAVAETLGGTESNFAKRMTSTAHSIGMKDTTFRNASGLPDRAQVTTARDMATLGLRLQRDFAQYYPYFRTRVC